jgi:lipopolysaccharide exporter
VLKFLPLKKYFSSYWIRSAFYTILQRFSLTFFGFINFIILIRYGLSKPQMGVWALFLVVTGIFETTKTNLLKNAHIKYMSVNDNDEKTAISSSSFIINSLITLLFILFILFFSEQLSGWLHAGHELSDMLKWFIPGLVFMVLFSHFEAVQQSHLDFKGVFAGYFVRQLLFFTIIVAHSVFHIPFELVHLAFYQSLSIFMGTITIYLYTRKHLLYRFHPTIRAGKKILGYGGYIFGSGMMANIFSNVDQIMTATFLKSGSLVANYNAATRINALIDIPSYAACEILFPKASRASVEEGKERVKYLYERMVAILLSFTTPTALVIILFPGYVISLIAGPQYIEAAPILQLYMITGILRPAQNQAANLLNSIGRPGLCFSINAASLAANLCINYICLMQFGFYGAAIGTLITCILGTIAWYIVMKKEIGFELSNIGKYIVETYKSIYVFGSNFVSKIKQAPAS